MHSVRLTASFNVDGTPTNPAAVTLTVKKPSGALVTPAPVNDGPGAYHADVTLDYVPGVWHYRWVGTGAAAAAEEGRFTVRASGVL